MNIHNIFDARDKHDSYARFVTMRRYKGRQVYLQKRLNKSGKQTILLTVHEKPAKVGFDPNHLLIDWNLKDDFKEVEVKK